MRLASIDILRTVAIVVMVFTHFGENLAGYAPPFAGLGAPLFVFLSGVSFFLWSEGRLARGATEAELTKVSVRRGVFIFCAGFAFNLVVWLPEDLFNWDVLTFIGSALLVLEGARRMPAPIRILVAVLAALVAPILRGVADYPAYWEAGYFECELTLSEALVGYLATGYFPLFPWIAFSLAGYETAARMFGRQVDRDAAPRGPWSPGRIAVVLVATSVGLLLVRPLLPGPIARGMLGGWSMFPPTTEYLLGTLGMAMGLLAILHRAVDLAERPRVPTGVLRLAKAFSRHSLSIYVLHHIVHLWPLWISAVVAGDEPTAYWREAMPTSISLSLAAVFLAVCAIVLGMLGSRQAWGLERCMRWLCD
ncbi:MAG: hypothetical protein RI967_1552 [Planctomycetota bacterium]